MELYGCSVMECCTMSFHSAASDFNKTFSVGLALWPVWKITIALMLRASDPYVSRIAFRLDCSPGQGSGYLVLFQILINRKGWFICTILSFPANQGIASNTTLIGWKLQINSTLSRRAISVLQLKGKVYLEMEGDCMKWQCRTLRLVLSWP